MRGGAAGVPGVSARAIHRAIQPSRRRSRCSAGLAASGPAKPRPTHSACGTTARNPVVRGGRGDQGVVRTRRRRTHRRERHEGREVGHGGNGPRRRGRAIARPGGSSPPGAGAGPMGGTDPGAGAGTTAVPIEAVRVQAVHGPAVALGSGGRCLGRTAGPSAPTVP